MPSISTTSAKRKQAYLPLFWGWPVVWPQRTDNSNNRILTMPFERAATWFTLLYCPQFKIGTCRFLDHGLCVFTEVGNDYVVSPERVCHAISRSRPNPKATVLAASLGPLSCDLITPDAHAQSRLPVIMTPWISAAFRALRGYRRGS